jgi:glycerol-3-phosphate O-acyltransferase
MGAYFIRRKSRNALYRKVLARYVQMATDGGVTQAIFPEGGLSLNGEVGAPKLGLMSYIIDGFEPGTSRDVVFIPVAMNYDRVLEDRVLVAADIGGHRKFRLRWKYIFRHVFMHLWQRVTGRFHRFGYASVSFGTPLSLAEFAAAHPATGDALAKPLALEIMGRIRKVVPVLPVPLVAAILLDRDGLTRAEVTRQFRTLVEDMEAAGAHIHMPRDNLDYAVEVGLRLLLLRKLIVEADGAFTVNPPDRPVLGFYANSIAHLTGKIEMREIAGLEEG